MSKNKFSVVFFFGLMLICGFSAAADNPGASFAAADLAHRLRLPESEIKIVAAESGADGTTTVSLGAPSSKPGNPTHRYTLRAAASAFQVVRVDRANGAREEYEYDGTGRLSAVKQFGRQGKLLHTVFYASDSKTGLDRVTQVLHNDWTKPQQNFIDSFDVYHYDASGAIEKVEKFPNEANTKPENLFVTYFYEGAPGLERIVKSVDRREMPTDYEYGKDGLLVRTLAGDKTVTEYMRDGFGEEVVKKTTDYRGMPTLFYYDAKGTLVKTAAGDGVVIEYTYINDTVLPSKKGEPNGKLTVYTYDASGAPAKTTLLDEQGQVIDEITYARSAGEAPAAEGAGAGSLKSASSSDGFKYTYTQAHYTDVIATATDPKGRTQVYAYDDLARPRRVVHREAGYVDEYDYSGSQGVPVSPTVKRYAVQGGSENGPLIGTLRYDAGQPARFDFADGSALVYEKGFAKELRSAKGGSPLSFKNEILSGQRLTGFKVFDASGKELGSYAAYEDPADVASTLLKNRTA